MSRLKFTRNKTPLETCRIDEINHFMYKHKRWAQTEKEKASVKRAIALHPNKNHAPTREGNML